ncbi:hypothetical protein ACF3M2_12415 [Tissierella carlieri]
MSKIIDDIKYEFSLIDKKKLLVTLVPYVFLYYIFNKIGELYRWQQSDNIFIIIYQMLLELGNLFKSPFPRFHPKDIAFGIVGAFVIYFIVYTKGRMQKNIEREKIMVQLDGGMQRILNHI